MRKLLRDGDTMIAVETAHATVEYSDILDHVEILPDHDADTPWESCDGFEHEKTSVRFFNASEAAYSRRGFVRTNRDAYVIELTGDDWGIFDHLRNRGASKQVAAEAVAAERGKTLDLLVKWHSDGWEYWGVECHYTALGCDCVSSVWGIDDYEYAETEVKAEIADEIARQLEVAGYTVTGRPQPEKRLTARQWSTVVTRDGIRKDHSPHARTVAEWRAEWKRNVNAQNWKD